MIKLIDTSKSTRILRVCLAVELSWTNELEFMRKKIKISITKIISIDMNPCQAAVYLNNDIIRSVHFGHRVLELAQKQELKMRRTCKEAMSIESELSRNFSRTILCSRRSVLGVELILLSALIAALKLKQCIRNKRKKGNTTKLIKSREILRNRSRKSILIRRKPSKEILDQSIGR